MLTNAWHACVHTYVCACDVRRTGKWPRVIGASRSTVRWCVTRSESMWRNAESLIDKHGSLVHAEIDRRVADRRQFPPISADRRPCTACKHRLPFAFSSRASAQISHYIAGFFVLVSHLSSSRCVDQQSQSICHHERKKRCYFACYGKINSVLFIEQTISSNH